MSNNPPTLESLRDSLREQSRKLAQKAQETYTRLAETLAKTTVTIQSAENQSGITVNANGNHELVTMINTDFLKSFFPEADQAQLEHASLELSKTVTMTSNEAIQKIKEISSEISKEQLKEMTADIDTNLLESNE